MMMRIISGIVAALLLCYLVFMSFMMKDRKEGLTCNDLTIVVKDSLDKHFVTHADLMSLLQQAKLYPVGKRMNAINTEQIEQKLKENEMIESVEVYKTPSGIIKLEVKQKMPILRVISSTGNFYVDNKGTVMPISRRYFVHVPIATGYIEKKLATTDLYQFALFLQENDFWNDLIGQIFVHPNGEVELIPLVGDQRILLGTFDGFKEKLDNLQLFYEQAMPKMGWDKYSMINLKFKDQIVCTKKDK